MDIFRAILNSLSVVCLLHYSIINLILHHCCHATMLIRTIMDAFVTPVSTMHTAIFYLP